MKIRVFLLLTAVFTQTVAAEATPELPPEPVVARVLREAPMIQAAAAQLRAEEARRQRLEAGSHEWTIRLGRQNRRELLPGGGTERYGEWNAALERPLRLPGKGALDAGIGAAGVSIAETGLGDARHETSRALLRGWFAWLKEDAASAQWEQQASLLAQHNQAVQRRQQLGDAARLEAVQSAAAQAQAEAQLAQARARLRMTEEELRRRFPGLPLERPKNITLPQALAGKESDWVAAVLEHNHELAIAVGETRRAQLLAERSRSERLPDPTLGVQLSRERDGTEKVLGAYISIPLPGSARHAASDAAFAESDAWAQREAMIRQKVSAEAATLYHAAVAALPGWQAAHNAAGQLGRSAEMTARAYQLGEGSLTEVLAARRLANEAELAARQARLEALELRYRLLLDTHQLWDLDAD